MTHLRNSSKAIKAAFQEVAGLEKSGKSGVSTT